MGMAAGSSRRKIKGGGGVLPIVTWNWVSMAAGSSRRKIKGGGGVLPIVTWNWVIRDCCFRTKKKSQGAGSFGTCCEFPGRGSRSFSVLTPDICFRSGS